MPVYDIEGPKGKSEEFIVFEDAVIKELCVKAFDINEDGELSYGEAALVTDLSQMTLTKKTFKTFDELKYFTSLTRIPKNYFKDIPIRSITLPESLKTIEDNAFANCSYLNSIVIPGNIGYKSFSCCTSLESVVFLESVTSIKSHAFDGCNSLTEVAIPSNITQLENSIFYDCASLSFVSFEENGAQILPYAFFENCIKLDNVVLPSTIKEIEQICEKHKGQKGLIHTHSMEILGFVKREMGNDNRYLYREPGISNEDIYKQHKERGDDTVMVSPSMTHGIDLKDNLGEFQIIIKAPYSPLGDDRIKKKFNEDKAWYQNNMLSTLIQACGRCNRVKSDYAVTYILDGAAVDAIRRNLDKLPKYFRERLQ